MSEPFATFVTFASRERRTLVQGDAARWRVLRRVAHTLGRHLWLFALADDHLHVVVEQGPQTAFRLGVLQRDLVRHDGLPLNDRHDKAVYSRGYLLSLLEYHVRQGTRHGIGPEFDRSGGCLYDLLGARLLPGFDRSWRQRVLPRLQDNGLKARLGVEVARFTSGLVPEGAELVRAGSFVVGQDIRIGQRREIAEARGVVLHIAREALGDLEEVVAHLGIRPRTARRLLSTPPEPRKLAALKRTLQLDAGRKLPLTGISAP